MKVRLHVERLVLVGFEATPRQQSVMRSAFATELSRLVTAGGLDTSFSRGTSVPATQAAPMHLNTTFDAKETGERIARAVYAGLGPASGGDCSI